ncbi:MAG TPA: hypothetical protein VJG90_08660 [Candidatus Nanoarchaeia archaeon]|nr:hypothetical protein [Candidatus Nanoarchaeia archaeon]
MKGAGFILFLLSLSVVSAYHTFDYTKNGFAVPGSVSVLIPNINEVIPAVTSTTLVTNPSNEGAQMFLESSSMSTPTVLMGVRWMGMDPHWSVPVQAINPRNRAPGVYIGDYGLSRQYIKSISK